MPEQGAAPPVQVCHTSAASLAGACAGTPCRLLSSSSRHGRIMAYLGPATEASNLLRPNLPGFIPNVPRLCHRDPTSAHRLQLRVRRKDSDSGGKGGKGGTSNRGGDASTSGSQGKLNGSSQSKLPDGAQETVELTMDTSSQSLEEQSGDAADPAEVDMDGKAGKGKADAANGGLSSCHRLLSCCLSCLKDTAAASF